jgi:N6-adenosine-specific RNA methylase IME4
MANLVRVDEVKNIRDKALAMEVYSFQAKDRELLAEATEVKMRATRRIGELMEEMKKANERAKKGRPKKGATAPKLIDRKIDKDLAKAARKMSVIPEKEFEKKVSEAIRLATASVDGDKAFLKEAKAERNAAKTAARIKKQQDLAKRIAALPDKKYGVILADPGWQFETWGEETGQDRAAANHYLVQTTAEIRAIPVAKIAADDCVLYLWATVPMLHDALDVMAAWEFEYVSSMVWVKTRIGTGYWARNQHELLLIGTKGKPAMPTQIAPSSVIVADRGAHSEKPVEFIEMIEKSYPDLPKIELNRRGPARPGWDAHGNEAQPAPAAPPVEATPVPPPAPAPVEHHTVAAE